MRWFFLSISSSDSFAMRSQAQSSSLSRQLTSSLSLIFAVSLKRISFCFSKRSRSGPPFFSCSRFLSLLSYCLMSLFCSLKAFSSSLALPPPWINCELNALIFSSSFFFSSLSLKNSFDLCCKAFITVFLSSSTFRFSSSSCISLVLSIMVLFLSSSSYLSLFSQVSYFLISAFWSRSSFIVGELRMFRARDANFRDERDSWNASRAGEIMVTMVVLQLPPKESDSILVRTEFLQGMKSVDLFSVKAAITMPRQLRLRLIFLHSSSLFPEAPVTLTLSDPAKSTKFNLATLHSCPSSLSFLICSIVITNTA